MEHHEVEETKADYDLIDKIRKDPCFNNKFIAKNDLKYEEVFHQHCKDAKEANHKDFPFMILY